VRDWYRRIYWDNDKAPRFVCSRRFIHSFMKRNRFSLRRQHSKRRHPTTNTAMKDWIQSLSSVLDISDNDLVLNCDETAWTPTSLNMCGCFRVCMFLTLEIRKPRRGNGKDMAHQRFQRCLSIAASWRDSRHFDSRQLGSAARIPFQLRQLGGRRYLP
jgi:hypothetical protein